jgi:hypothetical protein
MIIGLISVFIFDLHRYIGLGFFLTGLISLLLFTTFLDARKEEREKSKPKTELELLAEQKEKEFSKVREQFKDQEIKKAKAILIQGPDKIICTDYGVFDSSKQAEFNFSLGNDSCIISFLYDNNHDKKLDSWECNQDEAYIKIDHKTGYPEFYTEEGLTQLCRAILKENSVNGKVSKK